MADSDNTTALPFVTQGGRRKSCAVDDGAEGDSSVGVRPAEKIAARLLAPIDPCVVLLQEWEQAHHMAVVLCRLQQRLETRIRNALRASEPSSGPENEQSTDRQTRWDELDQEVGYSRARAAEAQAVEAEEEILDAVAATPAQSLAGVIAKLKIIVGGGETAGDMSSFPWPQIQSVLADLKQLAERDAYVLPRSADGRHGDSQPAGDRGLDGETNRLRASMSDGTIARESQPRRS